MAVFNRATVRNIKEKLDLEYYTPEFDWISSNHAEADRLNNFIKDHTVNGVLDPSAKEFGLAAIDAWMDGGSVDFDEQIIISGKLGNDFPCQTGIIMEAATSCSPLTQLILNIFEQDNDVNVVFDSSVTIPGGGQTSDIIRYNTQTKTCDITISFNESYLGQGTDLSLARTSIHESLHAVLVYMLFEGHFVTSSGNPDPEFSELVQGFVEFIVNNKPTMYGTSQHLVMSGLVDDIATSLSTYGRNNGYSKSFNFYTDLAWGGLTHLKDESGNLYLNPLFLEVVPNTSDRNRILSRLASEATNQTYNGINPEGEPCE